MNYFHTTTTTTSRSLDNHRIANILSNFLCFFQRFYTFIGSRENWNSCCSDCLSGTDFVPHPPHILSSRTNKSDPTLFTNLCKFSIFRKKTITRMNSISVSNLCSADNCFHIEITVGTCCRTNTDTFIGKTDMQSVMINIRMDCNSFDPHLFAGTNDPYGNFTTVGYKYFMKHFVNSPVEHSFRVCKQRSDYCLSIPAAD